MLAYQKIYADYNRYTQWERSNPSTFNLDYVSGSADSLQMDFGVAGFKDSFNLFDMRYCNWSRDLLHGTIPQAQYGEASAVPLSDNSFNITDGQIQFAEGSQAGDQPVKTDGAGYLSYGESPVGSKFNLTGTPSEYGSISVLAIRRAEAAQKWKEISLAAESDYPAQIEAHWGQSVNKAFSDMCQWLGSINIDLSINEVVNQNITGSNAADIAGKGTMSGNGSVNFNVGGQYGIVMCVFHVLPQLDYTTSAPHFGTLLTNVLQYPIPEFDKIGMEQVPIVRGMNPVTQDFQERSVLICILVMLRSILTGK